MFGKKDLLDLPIRKGDQMTLMKDKIHRIAILGTENSHARAFAQMAQHAKGVELVGAYGSDPEANKNFKKLFGVPCTDDPEAFLGDVDGVMVTARDGSKHLELARPYLRPGMSVFVDKPFCNSVADAEELIRFADLRKASVCGGSCLKYSSQISRFKRTLVLKKDLIVGASFYAPVEMDSPYGGFLFYAPHLIEMALNVFGYRGLRSVRAVRDENKVFATLYYNGFAVTLFFGGNLYVGSIAFTTTAIAFVEKDVTELYGREFANFCAIMRHRASALPDPEELVAPVRVANAIVESYETDTEVRFHYPL